MGTIVLCSRRSWKADKIHSKRWRRWRRILFSSQHCLLAHLHCTKMLHMLLHRSTMNPLDCCSNCTILTVCSIYVLQWRSKHFPNLATMPVYIMHLRICFPRIDGNEVWLHVYIVKVLSLPFNTLPHLFTFNIHLYSWTWCISSGLYLQNDAYNVCTMWLNAPCMVISPCYNFA